jgi:putative SOS response-associated peptidase YedK
MCGRFVSSSPPDEIAKYFAAQEVSEEALEPSFNVAPTNDVYVVVESGGVRRLDTFHWGLVPFWAKDPSAGNKMINARAETLTTKNAYKRSFAKRRCIIPADGFFEWKKIPGQKTKQPMFIHRTDGEPLAFAGLWELWRPKDAPEGDDSQLLRSCTIITGEPNEKIAKIHDRMPVMLPPSAWDTWLDPANDDLDTLGKLLVPAPADLLAVHPVSTAVNNVRVKGPELIEPVEADLDGTQDAPR